MLDIRKTLGGLLLLMAVVGCSPPTTNTSATRSEKLGMQELPADNRWVTSDDGKLALRFSVISSTVRVNESIRVAAVIRNNGARRITVFRPFGDHYVARAKGMKIWDRQRQIGYTGPNLSYVVGSSGFAILDPGEIVEDQLDLTIDNFAGTEAAGSYTLRYDYSYAGEWDTTAAVGACGIRDAWRGTLGSREVQVVRE
jgi:hypothetical protein